MTENERAAASLLTDVRAALLRAGYTEADHRHAGFSLECADEGAAYADSPETVSLLFGYDAPYERGLAPWSPEAIALVPAYAAALRAAGFEADTINASGDRRPDTAVVVARNPAYAAFERALLIAQG